MKRLDNWIDPEKEGPSSTEVFLILLLIILLLVLAALAALTIITALATLASYIILQHPVLAAGTAITAALLWVTKRNGQ